MTAWEDLFNKLAGKEEELKPEAPIVVPPLPGDVTMAPAERRELQLKEAETRLLEKTLTVLDASVSTFELTDAELQAPKPPERWVREDGPEKAMERFNIARNARLNKRDAPIAIDIASKVHAAATRARAAKKGDAQPLNAVVVSMTLTAPPAFEEREVVTTEGQEEWDE